MHFFVLADLSSAGNNQSTLSNWCTAALSCEKKWHTIVTVRRFCMKVRRSRTIVFNCRVECTALCSILMRCTEVTVICVGFAIVFWCTETTIRQGLFLRKIYQCSFERSFMAYMFAKKVQISTRICQNRFETASKWYCIRFMISEWVNNILKEFYWKWSSACDICIMWVRHAHLSVGIIITHCIHSFQHKSSQITGIQSVFSLAIPFINSSNKLLAGNVSQSSPWRSFALICGPFRPFLSIFMID